MLNIDLEKVVAQPVIRYELPLSKVVQAVKKNSRIETSWNIIQVFLVTCTNANKEAPDALQLTINDNRERDTSHIKNEITKAFGDPLSHFDGLYDQLKWKLNPGKLNQVIDLMINLQPFPAAVRPYISLRIDYEFEFVDTVSKKVLINQEYKSYLAVFLEKNSNVMPELWFPFSDINSLSDYLNSIQEFLPLKKLDKKAFRLIAPNKNNTRNVIKKLSL